MTTVTLPHLYYLLSLLVEWMDVSLISSEDSSCKANAAQHMGLLASAFINEGGIDLVLSNMGILNDTIEEEAEGIDDIL